VSDRSERLLNAYLEDLGTAPAPSGLGRDVLRRIRDERPSRASRFGRWWAVAGAVAVIAIGGVAFAVAGPSPTPLVTSPAPPSLAGNESPSPAASPTPRQSDDVPPPGTPMPPSIVPTIPPTYAPGAFSTQPSWRVNLIGADARHPVVVLVVDPQGRLTGAAPAAIRFFPAGFKSGIGSGSTDHAVDVFWIGTTCDGWATVELGADGKTVTVSTTQQTLPCSSPGGRLYGLELRFGTRVDATRFVLAMGPAQRYTNDSPGPSAIAFTDLMHGIAALSIGAPVTAAETDDGGVTWRLTPIGDGQATGLAMSGTTAWMAIACDPSMFDHCAAGLYRRDGERWTRVLAMDPGPLAVSGERVAVLDQRLENPALGVLPFPPTGIRVSDDNGATWSSIPNPCPAATPWLKSVAFRPTGLEAVCEGQGAGGTAHKVMMGADSPSSAWKPLHPLPEAGTSMGLATAPGPTSAPSADGSGLLWGARSPLLATADGGATWTAHRDVADGDVRIVLAANAWSTGGGAVVVWDPDRQATLVLTSTDGVTWTEMTSFMDVPCCGG
jgi:photosystem II stability/assembly factor-like uncharacterized protein